MVNHHEIPMVKNKAIQIATIEPSVFTICQIARPKSVFDIQQPIFPFSHGLPGAFLYIFYFPSLFHDISLQNN